MVLHQKASVLRVNWIFQCKSNQQSQGLVPALRYIADTARQPSLSITNSRSLPKLMSIELVMPSSHLILCRPLLPLPPIPPSIRVFSNESTWGSQTIGVSASASVLPMNSQDWFPLGLTDLIQPVHPKGDQFWVFIGRTDAWRAAIHGVAKGQTQLTELNWTEPKIKFTKSNTNPDRIFVWLF